VHIFTPALIPQNPPTQVLNRYAQHTHTHTHETLTHTPVPQTPPTQVLNRHAQHTQGCVHCSSAVTGIDRTVAVAGVVGLLLACTAVCNILVAAGSSLGAAAAGEQSTVVECVCVCVCVPLVVWGASLRCCFCTVCP